MPPPPLEYEVEENQSISPAYYSAHAGDVKQFSTMLVWMQENVWNRVLLERGTTGLKLNFSFDFKLLSVHTYFNQINIVPL